MGTNGFVSCPKATVDESKRQMLINKQSPKVFLILSVFFLIAFPLLVDSLLEIV
jgi:hypothetical protein